jgi:hypothetical protein
MCCCGSGLAIACALAEIKADEERMASNLASNLASNPHHDADQGALPPAPLEYQRSKSERSERQGTLTRVAGWLGRLEHGRLGLIDWVGNWC